LGRSPVAIAVALTLGTSYICTSTNDLQTQYARDFPFVRVAKGKNNFICAVKEDLSRMALTDVDQDHVFQSECYHTTADYGLCMNNEDFEGRGCRYRTFLKDYKINNKGTREEKVFIDNDTETYYRERYSQWLHLKNLREELRIWRACE
jgi:ATP-dependent DNA helicase DinG